MPDAPRDTSPRRASWLERLRRLPEESTAKTLLVAFSVAVVCATLVSTAAVALRPRQRENRDRERRARLVEIVSRIPGIEEIFARTGARDVETDMVELATGRIVPSMDASGFDARKAAQDHEAGVAIPSALDVADLGRRAKHAPVYLVKDRGQVKLVVLPVEGSGYGGPIRGFVALSGDGNTIVSLALFEHQETAGIGARVEDPAWRARWQGKRVRDEQGRLRVGVATERLRPEDAAYQVDGISGATITSGAVNDLLRYWLGDDGFGPFLRTLR